MVTVTSVADTGVGSLRAAIASAVPGEIIQFEPSLANQTIILTTGQLDIDKNLIIDSTNAPGLTISGNNLYRVFDVKLNSSFNPTTVTLRNLIVANGRSAGIGEEGAGGGIRAASGTILTVENSQFRNNISSGEGGGAIWAGFRTTATIVNSQFDSNDGTLSTSERGGGAIAINSESRLTVKDSQFTNNRGTNGGAINTLLSSLTVENSTFINNDSTPGGAFSLPPRYTRGYGGAIYSDGAGGQSVIRGSRFEGNKGAGQGGGLFLFAYGSDQVIVENSTIVNNQVIKDAKGDSLGGGIRQGNAELIIRNTTIANNLALQQGGGLWVGEQSRVTIANSTLSGNRVQDVNGDGLGGAIALINGTNPTTIVNSTIANNFAGFSAGAIFSGTETPVTVGNTIFANNTAGNPYSIDQQTNRELTDGGNNLQFPAQLTNGDPNDNNVTATIAIADPLLGPLQDNGNGILVHPLLAGSPAIDGGNNAIAPTTDQRGVTRPQDGDNNGSAIADIGAYEVSSTQPTTPQPTTPTRLTRNSNDSFFIEGNAGQAQLRFQLTASNTNFVNEVGVFAIDDDAGRVNGIAPGEAGYRQAALSRSQVIFSALGGNQFPNLRTTRQLSFDVGARLGFYLVPNSTTDAVRAGQTSLENVFFFTPQANADNFDHLQVSDLGNGKFNLGWEESLGGGDADFNDLGLTVELTNNPALPGTRLQGGEQGELIDLRDSVTGLVPAQITVNSEAYYNNSFGFYAVDDPTGRMGNLNPGDTGYAAAAVSGRIDASAGLPGGKLLVPFLIANGTPEQFLAENPNNQPGVGVLAYFPFLGANPDRINHVRLLGDNVFGFEDLLGGGDADFNDMVLQVNFA